MPTYQTKAEKLANLKIIADKAVHKVSQNRDEWRDFLDFYSKFYKYSFSEALLIYEQAPNSTACGELKHWNMVGRRVHKGSKSIPIINETDRNMEIRHVFDVSSTYGEDRGIPRRWVLPEKYHETVVNELQRKYSVSPIPFSHDKGIKWAIEEYARDASLEFLEGIHYDIKDSFLEELDMDNIRKEFVDTVVDSVGYLISERLELPKGFYATDEALEFFRDFNTKSTISRLGVAVNHISRSVLTLVSQTVQGEIKKEREGTNGQSDRNAGGIGSIGGEERTATDSEGNRGNGNRENADVIGNTGTRGNAATEQIRDTGVGLFEGTPSEQIRFPNSGNENVGSVPTGGNGSQSNDDGNRNDIESAESAPQRGLHGNSAVRGQNPQSSGGNSSERDSIQNQIKETTAHRNFNALTKLAPEILSNEATFMRFTAGESFMPLTIERLYGNRIAMAHNFVQNGDLMADPDMEFVFDNNEQTLSPRTYQLDALAQFQTTENDNGEMVNPRLEKDLNDFLNEWFSNIQNHGYEKEVMHVNVAGEQVKIVYDKIGKVADLQGDSSVVDEYAELKGIELNRRLNSETEPQGSFSMAENADDELSEESKNEDVSTKRISSVNEITSTEETAKTDETNTQQQQTKNFHITAEDDIGKGTPKQKYRNNIIAIETLKLLETESRLPTQEEQSSLARYSGWGGLPQAFDERNESWQVEYLELKGLLSIDEYQSALSSTLNAHFTPIEVIEGVYKGLERIGFNGGNILEPSMGVGNFFGMMPNETETKSKLYGVELDPVTGRIAQKLYPDAKIQINGFESADLPDNFFDVSVGNVPFGDYKLNDPKYDKYNFLIHDYFFCKTLDKVRPDGVIAFITSKGTMDKANPSVRRYLAERAELLGAIRLPSDTFKQSAGTEVTSDILFLKKRDRIIDASEEKWVFTGETLEGLPLNEYYIDNPQMMLGEFTTKSGPFGPETTVVSDNRNIKDAILDAVEYLPKNVYSKIANLSNFEDIEEEEKTIPADPTVKNFCHSIIDGEIYQRVNSTMVKKEFTGAKEDRVKAMIELRQLTRHILDFQLNGCSDEDLNRVQETLNTDYDKFYKKYGSINSRYNRNLFNEDADFPLLSALEELGDGEQVTKAAIFTKRTISQYIRPETAETATEALSIALSEKGYVDINYMAGLTSKTNDDIVEDLKGIIFKNPDYDDPDNSENAYIGYETADEYLSGDVRNKLFEAEKVAEENSLYQINVDALKSVQPTPLEAHEITVRIGSSWVDTMYYRKFVLETLKPPPYEHDRIRVEYSSYTGNWSVGKPYSPRESLEAINIYGTKRMNAYDLFELTLNQKSPKIFDVSHDEHGNEIRTLNHKETVAIREKQTQLKQEFKKWIFNDHDRRERLCATYNRLFNSTRLREYDGAHLVFPGMSPEISLMKHQKDAIARSLYGGNTLLAHVVGAGKTYTMTATAMELKRLGISKKCCFVVPNHLVLQWSNEFQRLYPTANILAATKKDFEKQNRQRFCARISTGEWDAVIIGHSQFERIPMSKSRQEARYNREIQKIENAIIEAKSAKGENYTIKELQRALKNVQYEVKKLQDSPKDSLVTFEQTGIDALFVDEAHGYKELYFKVSFKYDTLLKSATALFAVHSEGLYNVGGIFIMHGGSARQLCKQEKRGSGVHSEKKSTAPTATLESDAI